jgi:hypothetical protein
LSDGRRGARRASIAIATPSTSPSAARPFGGSTLFGGMSNARRLRLSALLAGWQGASGARRANFELSVLELRQGQKSAVRGISNES